MAECIAAQIKALQGMTAGQLRAKWREIFGEETMQQHRVYLWKRLAWKIQANHYGGLSDEATTKIAELRGEFEHTPPSEWLDGGQKHVQKTPPSRSAGIRDPRLPQPGTVLSRHYKGQDVAVMVLEEGFEYQGQLFRSLSAIAREVTGSNWNGYSFFRLTKGGSR